MDHVKSIFRLLIDYLPDLANILLAVMGVWMSFPQKAQRIEENPRLRNAFVRSLGPNGLAASDPMGLLERVENILAVTGSRRWSSSRMPGGLVYSQAAFFFETCAGRRSIFFSSPSACRCAYLILYPIFAMSTVCSVFRAQRQRCQTT